MPRDPIELHRRASAAIWVAIAVTNSTGWGICVPLDSRPADYQAVRADGRGGRVRRRPSRQPRSAL